MRVRLSVSPNKVQVASLHGVYTVIDAWYSARPPLTKPSQCSRTHDHESVILCDTIAHSLLLWERLPCSSGGPCRLRGSLSLLQGRESAVHLPVSRWGWCHPRAGASPHHQPRPLLQARSPHGSPAGGAWAPPPSIEAVGASSAGAATDAKMQRCWSQRGAAATRAVGEEPLARVGRLAAAVLRRHEDAPRERGGGRLEVLLWRHGP